MFVRYECDCVGLIVTQSNKDDADDNELHILIKPTDNRCDCDPDVIFSPLKPDNLHRQKKWVPLNMEETQNLVKSIDWLVAGGWQMKKMKFLLSLPVAP